MGVTDAPNEALRSARATLNLGQAELAQAINGAGASIGGELRCDVRQIAKWEAGEVRWPQARYRRALEGILGVPCQMLGFQEPPSRRPRPVGSPADPVAEEDDVRRRQFLTNAVTLAATASLTPLFRFDKADEASAQYVETTEHTLGELQSLERKFGSGLLLPLIDHQIHNVEDRLRAGDDSTGVKSVAAWAFMLGGWMHFDANKYDRANQLCKEALYYAQMAGDRNLVARTANVMSMQAAHLQRPREAVQLARLGAAQFPPTGRVAALLAAREARGWAQLGAERETKAALDRMHRAFSGVGPAPDWVSFFTEGELAGANCSASTDLGELDVAENLARQAVADPKLPQRAAVSFRTMLVELLVRRNDLAEAGKEIDAVMPLLTSVSSPRVGDRVRAIVEALPKTGSLGDQRRMLAAFA